MDRRDFAPQRYAAYAAYGAVLLLAATYCVVGITFAAAAIGGSAQVWRLAAWLVNAAFALHITFERLRLRSTTVTAALRVSLAAALGAFGLAAAAMVRARVTGTGNGQPAPPHARARPVAAPDGGARLRPLAYIASGKDFAAGPSSFNSAFRAAIII